MDKEKLLDTLKAQKNAKKSSIADFKTDYAVLKEQWLDFVNEAFSGDMLPVLENNFFRNLDEKINSFIEDTYSHNKYSSLTETLCDIDNMQMIYIIDLNMKVIPGYGVVANQHQLKVTRSLAFVQDDTVLKFNIEKDNNDDSFLSWNDEQLFSAYFHEQYLPSINLDTIKWPDQNELSNFDYQQIMNPAKSFRQMLENFKSNISEIYEAIAIRNAEKCGVKFEEFGELDNNDIDIEDDDMNIEDDMTL